jgi:hypothetical protein
MRLVGWGLKGVARSLVGSLKIREEPESADGTTFAGEDENGRIGSDDGSGFS